MNAQGFNAMMQGQNYIPSNKPQILGKGAYSAPTFRGANRYAGTTGISWWYTTSWWCRQ